MLRFFKLNFLLLYIFLICTSCLKQAALKSFKDNKPNAPYDAIIVPGFPFEDSVWHDVMKIRVYWSHYLYEKGYAKNIIYSGSAVYSPYVESEIMKAYGVALGIPVKNIYTESMAKHSTENLYYSYQLAKNHGFKKIALATDPYQNMMLKGFARKNELDVDFIPIVFDTLKHIDKINPPIDPKIAYVENFVALPEKVGFFERLKGTLGYKIDPTLYNPVEDAANTLRQGTGK
ncbi:YdcF family protein [Catalinimonas niigatensis]|uniref:YdcF family protein n=1 Tax=Catalinimonas niigatensis TaxID=1397264 RepID=UPI002665E844|nr:YdcF family protein [Catalinimonas niigatensis]WPP48774.1 YdcF family protein [Catalinimonas niigatensis]